MMYVIVSLVTLLQLELITTSVIEMTYIILYLLLYNSMFLIHTNYYLLQALFFKHGKREELLEYGNFLTELLISLCL